MRRRAAAWLALAACGLLLAACDEDGSQGSSQAPAAQAQAAQAQDLPAAYSAQAAPAGGAAAPAASAPAITDLKDAVAAAPAAAGRADLSAAVFDGDRAALRSPGAAASAFDAAAGSRSPAPVSLAGLTPKTPVYTAPARPDTLRTSEPPPPGQRSASSSGSAAQGEPDLAGGPSDAQPDGGASAAPAAAGDDGSRVVDLSVTPRVLVLGDSHSVGAFGAELVKQLSAWRPGYEVSIYAVGGSSPFWFAAGPRVAGPKSRDAWRDNTGISISGVAKLSELWTPMTKQVVVALGTNQIDWNEVRSGQARIYGVAQSVELAEEIRRRGASCVWIGPPEMRGYRGTDPKQAEDAVLKYDQTLRSALGGLCSYIPSVDKTGYEGGDGIHYSAAAARRWADTVAGSPLLKQAP